MKKREVKRKRIDSLKRLSGEELVNAFLEFMKGKTAADLMPEKTIRAFEDLKRAGLIP